MEVPSDERGLLSSECESRISTTQLDFSSSSKHDYIQACGLSDGECLLNDPLDNVLKFDNNQCPEVNGELDDLTLSLLDKAKCKYSRLVNCVSKSDYSTNLCTFEQCIGGPKDADGAGECGECINSPMDSVGGNIQRYQGGRDLPGWDAEDVEDRVKSQHCGAKNTQTEDAFGSCPQATCLGRSWASEEHNALCMQIFESNKVSNRRADGVLYGAECNPIVDCSIRDISTCTSDIGCEWSQENNRCISTIDCIGLANVDGEAVPGTACTKAGCDYKPATDLDINEQCGLYHRGRSEESGISAYELYETEGEGENDLCACACPSVIEDKRNIPNTDPVGSYIQ